MTLDARQEPELQFRASGIGFDLGNLSRRIGWSETAQADCSARADTTRESLMDRIEFRDVELRRPLSTRDRTPIHGFGGWRIRLEEGPGIPTPAVEGKRVYVGGGFGSYDFFALDAESGEILWHRQTSDDGPTAAVVADGLVAFNTESCTLEVLRGATGEVVRLV